MVLEGTGDDPITVTYTNRFGRERRYQTTYEGLVPWLVRRHENADGDGAREVYQQYMRLVPCETCKGARLNPVSLAVTIGGLNINELSSLSLRKASEFLDVRRTGRPAGEDRRRRPQGGPGPAPVPRSTSASTT